MHRGVPRSDFAGLRKRRCANRGRNGGFDEVSPCRVRSYRRVGTVRLCSRRRSHRKLGEPPEVLSDSSQRELELGAPWPPKRSRSSWRMRLRWANSISTRFLSRRDCSNASVLEPGNIAGRLIEAARDSAHRRLRTALRFEGTAAALAHPGSAIECLPIAGQLAGRRQNLAGRADVNVGLLCRRGSLRG